MEYHSGGSLPLLGRPRYCPGANANGGYLCETGHCCGETGCCTYYYELWWFWLLWTVLILFSCCCAYRHRRAKLRVQQQQRQREISLLAYHGANSYPSSMLDLSFLASLKLPSYEEVAAQPSTPPPPYSSVFTTPRYPQPPRAADPHLLTQHGPLLHRPLSDGPSSLSSDNSSSCSCDSCCPSSPCSSSLSAPVTYETDTSHASTPSEAAPLTLDVTMETITAAATCLEENETRFASERMVATVAIDIGDADAAGAQEPGATDSSVPNQTVTVAVVTRAASPQPLPSPGSEVALPVGATSPIKQQLDLAPCSPIVSTCSPSTLPDLTIVNTTLPSIQIMNTDGSVEGSTSGPSTPTTITSNSLTDNQTLETLNLTRTFDTVNIPSSPTSVPSPDDGRTLALITGSTGVPTHDPNPSLVPIPAPSNLTQASVPVPTNLTPAPDPVPSNLTQAPDPAPSNLTQTSVPVPTNLTQASVPVPSNLTETPVPVPTNLTQASVPVPSNLTQASVPVPKNLTQTSVPVPTNLTPAPGPVPSNLTQASVPVPTNLTQASDPVLTNQTQAPVPVPTNLTQAPVPVPSNLTQASVPVLTNLTRAPDPVPSNLTQASVPIPTNFNLVPDPVTTNLTLVLDSLTKTTLVSDSAPNPILTPKPAHSNLTLATDTAPKSPTLTPCQNPQLSPGSGLALVPPSPKPSLPQHPEAVPVSCLHLDAVPANSGPSLVLSQSPESDLISQVPSDVQAGFSFDSGSGTGSGVGSRSGPLSSPVPTPAFSSPSSFCPAITIESASSFTPSQSPLATISPSSPPSLPSPPSPPSPPALTSTSLPAPALLLDPLTALHQSEKGGSSSGHASSLSPSPRATQSPPKQTLFSPCVDVFEPGPPSWEEGEEEQEVEDNDDDEEEDMGADESQYRHRRLTGDSGIEVCRCRVEEEEDEEDEEEEVEGKEDDRRGGVAERDKKGSGNTDLHDSVDCPARGQITTGEGLTLCNPTSTTTPTSEDSGEVVIVMETV
ncbi:mucin-2-like [Thunnus albacares]|uniref:mucin-2-like n=1 Tax=Thunnus albacares TaxID=8236 RepID=UPI001CF63DB9|nr:mucin-2-like [Thunnus albacares]XP_044197884.1 mucin-2-like [Thunnus albacares]